MNRITNGEGLRFLLDFWKKEYLQDYIPYGGSKIKFLTVKNGSGKSYALNEIRKDGESLHYLTVSFSAETVYLNDFKEIYTEIIKQIDIQSCLKACADKVVSSVGKDPSIISEGHTAMDYFTSTGEMSIILRGELREALTGLFLKNPQVDLYFSQACALIVSSYLGLLSLDDESIDLLISWMYAKKEVKVFSLKPLGLSPVKITKLNARHMLRSLCEVVRLPGKAGLLVLIDDLDIMLSKEGNGIVKYTKMKRNDTYESIRQLIDDIDTLHYIMFIFAFDRIMIENESSGFKSYQVLWMRIQNEIEAARFNCFTDIADLDRLARQEYSIDYLMEMSLLFAEEAENNNLPAQIISPEKINELIRTAALGTLGLPALIKNETLNIEG